ncbi:MAG: hypothetical protein M3R58_11440 [Pseudomonadota bacterium]|nr:hypothetical protein [Pseudomonadota bacterium]
MKKSTCVLVAVLAAIALPAQAAWELLRGNESQRLSIDPKSVKSRGAETSFKYLVDFRELQGESGGKYRSLVVGAALRCKPRTIALRSFELYAGAGGNGVLLAMPAPKPAEKRFQPVQKGSSDEDLFQRVCEKTAPAKKK